MKNNEKPGALVIGGDFQGLGIIKSLAINGIPTVLIDSELCIGKFSRYKSKFLNCPDVKKKSIFLNFLKTLAKDENLQGWVVYPNNDEVVRFLAENKEELEEFYRIPTPKWEISKLIYDKKLTYQLADKIGISIPQTFYPKKPNELSKLKLEFPVIIKPSIRDHFYSKTKCKAIMVRNKEELVKGYKEACLVIDPSEVMIQELIPGGANNLFSLGVLFKNGKVIAKIMAKRSRQHPMDFGHATTYAESIYIPELEELGTQILKAIDYYGLAEVEFMYDPRDNKYKFLEINGRVWGWHTLARAAGVDLPYLLYKSMMGEKILTNGTFAEGVKWIRPITDVPTATLEILKGKMKLKNYLRSFKGKKEFAPAFSLDDPLPFVFELILLPYLWRKRGF